MDFFEFLEMEFTRLKGQPSHEVKDQPSHEIKDQPSLNHKVKHDFMVEYEPASEVEPYQ